MIQRRQRLILLFRGSLERNTYVSMAKVGRKKSLRDGSAAHSRVGEFVADQLFQLLADAFGDAFVPMGVHIFRIQYVRENSGVFTPCLSGMGPAFAGLLRVRPD